MPALVFLLLAYPAPYTHRIYLVWGLVFYLLAKFAEFADAGILAASGGAISGHSLKHLLAAGTPYFVYLMLRDRKAIRA